jgi:hypothetical protein
VRDKLEGIVCELLAQSLLAWGLIGRVQIENDHAILIACNATRIRIEPSLPGLPFRWIVTINGRKRGAISLVAVLRQVHAALDPGYAINRVHIAPLPPLTA